MELDIGKIIKTYFFDGQYHNVTELCHIMKKNNVDKGLGLHNYSTFYEYLFSSLRHSHFDFLEIGYKKYGLSVAAWKQYFSNARILYADDANPSGKTSLHVFDQRSEKDIHRLMTEIGDMDVIIDDAFHQFQENLFLLQHMFQHLNDGGIYIVEDMTEETKHLFLAHKQRLLETLPIRFFFVLDIPYPNNSYDNRLLVFQKEYKIPLTIVVASSQAHAGSLIQFLCSLIVHKVLFDNLFIYDLGLEPGILITIKEMFSSNPNMKIRCFCYYKYPPYFNIEKNAGQYAWKAVIISEVAYEVKKGLLLWCDAGNKVVDDLLPLVRFMKENSIYLPPTSTTISDSTHPDTIVCMDAHDVVAKPCRSAGQVCFSLNKKTLRLIDDWSAHAQMEPCIAPVGSDRSNHRYDSSILSVLYYRFIETYPEQLSCPHHEEIFIRSSSV
jgi:hypothetical protein